MWEASADLTFLVKESAAFLLPSLGGTRSHNSAIVRSHRLTCSTHKIVVTAAAERETHAAAAAAAGSTQREVLLASGVFSIPCNHGGREPAA